MTIGQAIFLLLMAVIYSIMWIGEPRITLVLHIIFGVIGLAYLVKDITL
jgi:hypothetical protein